MQSAIVASIQFKPKSSNVDYNLKVAQQYVFEAAAKGAKVIVLPELATSGNSFKNVRDAALCSQDKNGYQTAVFSPIASKFKCHVVFGYPELSEGLLYNSAAVVGPNGLETNIRKHNLWGNDNFWANPSDQYPPVALTAAGRLGVLISSDITNNFRDTYQFLNPKYSFYPKGSVDTIAVLSNWNDNYGYPDSRWLNLNESVDSNLIFSNRVGREGSSKFRGGSCIIDRNKKIWTNGSSFKNEAVVGGIILI